MAARTASGSVRSESAMLGSYIGLGLGAGSHRAGGRRSRFQCAPASPLGYSPSHGHSVWDAAEDLMGHMERGGFGWPNRAGFSAHLITRKRRSARLSRRSWPAAGSRSPAVGTGGCCAATTDAVRCQSTERRRIRRGTPATYGVKPRSAHAMTGMSATRSAEPRLGVSMTSPHRDESPCGCVK